jgi:hypothetical protein
VVFHCAPLNHARRTSCQSPTRRARMSLGARTVASVAKERGATEFVLVSADRAAHCAGRFDMSKALAEQVVLQLGKRPRRRRRGELSVLDAGHDRSGSASKGCWRPSRLATETRSGQRSILPSLTGRHSRTPVEQDRGRARQVGAGLPPPRRARSLRRRGIDIGGRAVLACSPQGDSNPDLLGAIQALIAGGEDNSQQ